VGVNMRFTAESELVRQAIRCLPLRCWLQAPKNAPLFQATEVKGFFGVPDLVAAVIPSEAGIDRVPRAIAFEMKLSDWRRGLIQAFRYRAFARLTYVVLDNCRVGPALTSTERFKRSNVGLIGLESSGKFTVYYEPDDVEPFCPRLVEKFSQVVQRSLALGSACMEGLPTTTTRKHWNFSSTHPARRPKETWSETSSKIA
jgi:hypothetical protein